MLYYSKKNNFNGNILLIITFAVIVFASYGGILISDIYSEIKKLIKHYPEIFYLSITAIILSVLLIFSFYIIIKLLVKIHKDKVLGKRGQRISKKLALKIIIIISN